MSNKPKQDKTKEQPLLAKDEGVEAVAPDEVVMADKTEHEPSVEEESVSIEEQLAAAQAKAEEYLDGWQRARAELVNYKKRIDRERDRWADLTRGEIIKAFLPVLDDFERALDSLPDNLEGQEWAEGIQLIYRKLQGILEAQGISEIEGQPFDPVLHEAVTHEPSDEHETGCVVAVMQKGYRLNDLVIRPAMVRVAS